VKPFGVSCSLENRCRRASPNVDRGLEGKITLVGLRDDPVDNVSPIVPVSCNSAASNSERV
jgi:hypothetical protein